MKIRKTTIVLMLVLLGYVTTWRLAPTLVKQYCIDQAEHLYADGLAEQARREKMRKDLGEETNPSRPIVNPGGPRVTIGLNLPILPCVLVVNNNYVVGPLWAKGQVSFFFYYGLGVARMFEITMWVS